jgi:hypothetical protein
VDGSVVNDGAVQVGFSPGAQERSGIDEERADRDDDELAAVEGRRIGADARAENFLREGEGEIGVVDVVAGEGEEDDDADDPEELLEFEVGGGEGHLVVAE